MKPQVENGFIQIATGSNENDILSALISSNLTATEYQVALTVIRKTWGWKKNYDWISISQFIKLTGKSKQSIITATSLLVKQNILVKETVLGVKTVYSFNKDFSSWVVKKTVPVKRTVLVKETLPSGKADFTGVVKQTVHTKETITKETITKEKRRLPKKEDIENIDIRGIQKDYQVPESFVLSCWDNVMNYCHAHGKKYINFNMVLRKFVKEDALKLRKEQHDKSKIVFIPD